MQTVTLQKAQNALPELVHKVVDGEQFTITEHGEPLALLSSAVARPVASREEILRAIDNSPIRFTSSWDDLKKEVR